MTKQNELTLANLEVQMADLQAKKVALERAAAVDTIPLYGEILAVVQGKTVTDLVAKLTDLQGRLPAGSTAHQQLGHVATVLNGQSMFFTAERTRLEALVAEPEAQPVD